MDKSKIDSILKSSKNEVLESINKDDKLIDEILAFLNNKENKEAEKFVYFLVKSFKLSSKYLDLTLKKLIDEDLL